MTRLSSAFGEIKDLRTKTFELGGHTFKVRVPLSKEMESIDETIKSIPAAKIDERFKVLSKGFKTDEPIDGVEFKKNDVVVDGRSIREMAHTILMTETRIVEFIKLLIPENGSLDDITYEEIEAEWPMQIQFEIVEKISEAIRPGYKEARKN